MYKVDLNSDLGESFGRYTVGCDEEILHTVSSVNIACGVHAGDPMVMNRAVQRCKELGVAPGVHPGFPDLQGFGRRQILMNPGELKNYIVYQIGALSAFAKMYGMKLQHVKPHGALNNMMPYNEMYSKEICEAILAVDPELILVAPTNTMTLEMARDMGLKTVSEVFADRAYQDDGYLVSRAKPHAMITDENEAIQRWLCSMRKRCAKHWRKRRFRLSIWNRCYKEKSGGVGKYKNIQAESGSGTQSRYSGSGTRRGGAPVSSDDSRI